MNLYQINAEIEMATEECFTDHETGEINEGLLRERIGFLGNLREETILDMACLAKNYEAEAEAVYREIEKLNARAVRATRKSEGIKEFLTRALKEGEKFSDGRVKISWRKSSRVVLKVDEKELPEYFQRVRTHREVDKTLIRFVLSDPDHPSRESLLSMAGIEVFQNLQIK